MRKFPYRERTPSFRGRLLVRPQRGLLVAQKWPRKRPAPRSPVNEWWSEWLRQADILAKYAPDTIQLSAREAAAGTAQMPRDLIISSMRGRLFYIQWEDGHWTFPMAAARDISESLDILSYLKGSILVRGDTLWQPITPPSALKVLLFNPTTGLPAWEDMPPTPNVYSPPLVSAFPTLVGSPTPTTQQSGAGPLVLNRAAAAAGQRLGSALRALSAAPRTYSFGLRHAAELVSNTKYGLAIRDNATGKSITFAYTMLTPTSTPRVQVDYWTNDTTWSSTPTYKVVTHQNTLFLRLHDDGTNFTFYLSADDANYEPLATLGRTAHLANPSHVGFCVASGAAQSIGSTLAAIHYHDE